MRLADRHGRPLSEVMAYSSWEMAYWSVWMSREPADGRRVEWILATFLSQWMGAHMKKGHKPPKPHELIVPDYWAQRNERQANKRNIEALIESFSDAGIPVKFNNPEK